MVYTKNNHYELHLGNMLEVLPELPAGSIDAIITDPPYELGFMGKAWDSTGVAFQQETWGQCLRVLKPGGYLVAFGGTRTFHRIACVIEDAGFEIRDTIMWIYGSGFPKSLNIGLAIDKRNGIESPVIGQNEQILQKQAKDLREGKRTIVDSYNAGASDRNNGFVNVSADIRQAQNEWAGYGSTLKPAYEPIILARKPFNGTLTDNVLKNGVGGLNIDECRIDYNGEIPNVGGRGQHTRGDGYGFKALGDKCIANSDGRFPSNIILTYDDTDEKEVCGGMSANDMDGSAARYFYCAKASKRDRDEGLDEFEEKKVYGDDLNWGYGNANGDNFGDRVANVMRRNTHPTVKPTALMQYLIRLVAPKGATILDPFNGSGSTGKAVMYENKDRDAGYYYIGVELTEEYLPISKARIDFAIDDSEPLVLDGTLATTKKAKTSLW